MRWELMVIGTALTDPGTMAEAEDLRPSDFTGDRVGVWAEMLSLHERRALSPQALVAAMENSDVSNVGSIIKDALEARGDNMKAYVDEVLAASTKRSLQRAAALINAEARENEKSAEELLDYAEKTILALRRNRVEGQTLADIVSVFMPRLQALRNGTFKPAWVPKTRAVKEIVQYAEESDFLVVASRPGEGKSSWLRFEAYHHVKQGGRVLIFNLENDPIEYARYMIALDTGIDSAKLKSGRVTDAEAEIIRTSAEKIMRWPLMITFASSAKQVETICRRKIAEDKYNLIMVDYIQLVKNGIQKKNDDVAETTRSLRMLAFTLRTPLLAASQLSREIEKRGAESDPMLSDLRDSGAVEQDCTIALFPRSMWTDPTPREIASFPENVDPRSHQVYPRPKAIPIQFHVKKNRNGDVGTSLPVKWVKSTGNYVTLEQR